MQNSNKKIKTWIIHHWKGAWHIAFLTYFWNRWIWKFNLIKNCWCFSPGCPVVVYELIKINSEFTFKKRVFFQKNCFFWYFKILLCTHWINSEELYHSLISTKYTSHCNSVKLRNCQPNLAFTFSKSSWSLHHLV